MLEKKKKKKVHRKTKLNAELHKKKEATIWDISKRIRHWWNLEALSALSMFFFGLLVV